MANRWKTYLLLAAMQRNWMSRLLARSRRSGDAMTAPDPDPGDASRWSFLDDLDEMARYAVILGYLRRLKPQGDVLDVGSGTGVLAVELAPGIGSYLGIDRDATSVEKARSREIPFSEFEVADAQTYTTDAQFDAVIFNESLYYLKDPIHVVQRYANFLKPDGVVVLSNYVTRHQLRIPGEIAKHFPVVDQTTVINASGRGWVIQVVQPVASTALPPTIRSRVPAAQIS